MNPLFKFYLDGVLLADEPAGWAEFSSELKRGTDINGIFLTQDVKLTFTGDGYDLLFNKFYTNYCSQTAITILELRSGQYRLFFEGLIFLTACEHFANICTITATLEDNSFYAKIKNNKSIETFVQVGRSKNLVDYTGAQALTFWTFDVCTAVYETAYDRAAVTPYEAFRSLIAFMTDDTCDFESTLFEPGGEWNNDETTLVITNGYKLSIDDNTACGIGEPFITKFSFLQLFTEMNKNIHIGMMVDNSGVRPKIIIEKNSFFYQNESLVTFDNVNGLKVYIDQESLYGTIRFGSSKTLDGSACPDPVFPEQQDFLSFKDEQYYVLGTCNIDKELDLVRDWVVSSNVIQSTTDPINDDSRDEDLFLVVLYKTAGQYYGKMGNPFGFLTASPRYWNEQLMNNNVADRYLGGVPNSIASTLSDITDECYVGRVGLSYPAAPTSLNVGYQTLMVHTPNEYNDKTTSPFFDTNNRFTLNPTNQFTCGTSGGLYAFEITQVVNVSQVTIQVPYNQSPSQFHYIRITPRIYLYDSLNNQKAYYDCISPTINASVPIGNNDGLNIYTYQPFNDAPLIGNHTIIAYSPLIVMDPNDYVFVSIRLYVDSWSIGTSAHYYLNLLNGTFKTTFTSKGGGDLHPYDPTKYPVYKYEFSYPLSCEAFDLIKENPNKSITLNYNGLPSFPCFIDQCKYNYKTGIGDFTLVRPQIL